MNANIQLLYTTFLIHLKVIIHINKNTRARPEKNVCSDSSYPDGVVYYCQAISSIKTSCIAAVLLSAKFQELGLYGFMLLKKEKNKPLEHGKQLLQFPRKVQAD